MPVILTKTQPLLQRLSPALIKQWGLERFKLSTDLVLPNIERHDVVSWLQLSQDSTKKTRMQLENLQAALLQDLNALLQERLDSLLQPNEEPKRASSLPSRSRKAQFIFLAMAGALLAFCEGYDGISTILGVLIGAPGLLTLALGLACAVVSVIVFSGFELNALSQQLGVSLTGVRHLLDVYVEQAEEVEQMRKTIEALYTKTDDLDGLNELKGMLAVLITRESMLNEIKKTYLQELTHPGLQVAKKLVALVTGGLYFSGGFFAGQTLALALTGALLSGATGLFWPIVIASVVVGLAAFAMYWYLERPALENIVGRWVGLDQEKVKQLPDEHHTELKRVAMNIDKKIADKTSIRCLENKLAMAQTAPAETNVSSALLRRGPSFFPPIPLGDCLTTPVARSLSISP